ncbi:MAG: protoglobin domain-containing protein, partial [Gammaproteobacteria bacterium]|nr:protoglobin domain-containing protein [Gammaproteobacteria bacterium]
MNKSGEVFNHHEVEELKAFLEFSDVDIDRLKQLHQHLTQNPKFFVNEFYDHLLKFDSTRKLIPDQHILERLKKTQTEYFTSLTQGNYDKSYIAQRFTVGRVHQQQGLEPRWYIGAYRKYLSLLIPRLSEIITDDPKQLEDSILAILKVIFFDIAIAMETYNEVQQQSILQQNNRLN